MTPEAFKVVSAGDVRVPRTLFWHGHVDGDVSPDFPPQNQLHPECIGKLPDNWNGTDKVYVWFLPTEPWVDAPFDFTLNAGTHGEAFNIHTQTVNNKLLNSGANVYLRVDLTTDLSTVIGLMASCDVLWLVTHDDNGMAGLFMGMEIQET